MSRQHGCGVHLAYRKAGLAAFTNVKAGHLARERHGTHAFQRNIG